MSDSSQDEQDLRATTDSLRQDAARLAEIEEAKLGTDTADPRMDELSSLAEDLVAEMGEKSEVQRDISRRIEPTDARGESD